jgi:hypothetical protein
MLYSNWSEITDQLKDNTHLEFLKFSRYPVFMTNRLLLYASFIIIFNSAFEFRCNAQELKGVEKYDTSLMAFHSPKKASFYSAVIPGLGQIYNKKYWKLPILYAGIGALIYSINYNHGYYRKFKKCYISHTDGDPETNYNFNYFGTNTKDAPDDKLLSAMDFYRRYRDMSALGLAGLYLANIIDATVDAYFYDYDVSQDLSLRIRPTLINSAFSFNFGVSCAFRF